jgi:hypothetical protein
VILKTVETASGRLVSLVTPLATAIWPPLGNVSALVRSGEQFVSVQSP